MNHQTDIYKDKDMTNESERERMVRKLSDEIFIAFTTIGKHKEFNSKILADKLSIFLLSEKAKSKQEGFKEGYTVAIIDENMPDVKV
jgi:hypothetical protein